MGDHWSVSFPAKHYVTPCHFLGCPFLTSNCHHVTWTGQPPVKCHEQHVCVAMDAILVAMNNILFPRDLEPQLSVSWALVGVFDKGAHLPPILPPNMDPCLSERSC